MSNTRTALALVAPILCAALAGCSASLDEDVAITSEPAPAASAPATSTSTSTSASAPAPKPSSSTAAAQPTVPTGGAASEPAPAEAPAEAPAAPSTDPAPTSTLSCTAQTMNASAPTVACGAQSYATFSGGTLSVGSYYLTQFSDDPATCTKPDSKRQGTLSVEEHDGQTYLRWIISFDGVTKSGVFLVTKQDPTTMSRSATCTKLNTSPPLSMNYSATSTQIVFVHANGQEKWTRIPKATSPGPVIDDPIFK
jgi:hypothetical protein